MAPPPPEADEADTTPSGEAGPDPDTPPRRRISRRNRRVLRDLHHRTWELELLLSGAVLFLLSQVPRRLDAAFYRMDAVAGEWAGLAAFMGYYFVTLMIYTLVVAFAFHLFTRAFWVALVGLDSVFPRGIRWDRLRLGPNVRRVYRSMLPTVRELIVKADAVASVTFAFAFAIVGGLAATIISFGVLVVIVLGVKALVPGGGGLDPTVFVFAVAGGVVALTLVTQTLDRRWGERLPPGGFVARTMRRYSAIFARVTGLEIYGPVQFTLFGQIGWRRASLGLMAVTVALVGYFIGQDLFLNRGAVEFAATRLVPAQAGALGVDPIYYDAYRRGEEGDYIEPGVPTIPTETLGSEDVWVRLFIPVHSSSDPAALARLCPDLPLPVSGGIRSRSIHDGAPPDSALAGLAEGLECLARLWTVDLDGVPVTAPPVFMRHPDSGLQGVARYLDTRDLAPGRHTLRVSRARAARPPDAEGPPVTHDILFWR